MSKAKDIFGKDYGLTFSDIDNAVKLDILHENDELEFTDIDKYLRKDKISKDKQIKKQKNKIISELVSFLNSGRGVGLLILGLKEKRDKLILKGVETFKTKEQIRASISSQIGSIPANVKPFKLDITPIPMGENKNIFFIEVESNDLDCVYYSKIDNNVYIRRGESAESLNLIDSLELLPQKNHARIFGKIIQKSFNDPYLFEIRLTNEGNELGKYISTVFTIFAREDLNYTINGLQKDSASALELEGDSILVGEQKNIINSEKFLDLPPKLQIGNTKFSISTFSCNAGYPPNTLLINPVMDGTIGQLTIEKKDFEMIISVQTFENRGHTSQEITIESNDGEVSIKDRARTFKPYLTL